MAKLKTRAEEIIAKIRAEAVTRKKNFNEIIAKIKAATEEKGKSYNETIAALKTKFVKQSKAQTEEMSKIKAELGIKMVKIKVEANKAIAKEQIRAKEAASQITKLGGKADIGIANIKFESDPAELAHSETIARTKPKTKKSVAKIKKFAEKISSYGRFGSLSKNSPMTSNKP